MKDTDAPMPETLRQLRLDRIFHFDGIEDHQVLHHTKEHCGKLETKLLRIREVLK